MDGTPFLPRSMPPQAPARCQPERRRATRLSECSRNSAWDRPRALPGLATATSWPTWVSDHGRGAFMHAIVIRTLTVLSVFAALHSADAQKWPGWSVFWENDSFIPPHLTSDRSYTNGVRFTLVRDLDHSPIKWVESFKTEVIDVLGGTRPFNASFA